MKTKAPGRTIFGMLALLLAAPCLAGAGPYFALNRSLDEVAGQRGPGKKLPPAPDGSVRVEYKEAWQGLKEQTVATYEQAAGSPSISRITLHIPRDVPRAAMLRALRTRMGLPPNRAVAAHAAAWMCYGVKHRLTDKAGAKDLVLEPATYTVGPGSAKGVILQDARASVTGKGRKDLIYLVGIPFDKGSIWMKSLYLVVVDPRGKAAGKRGYALGFGGLEVSEMLIRDFNGDGRKEILVTAPTGGSGGLNQYALVSLRGGVLRPLVDSRRLSAGPAFVVRFVDGFKARVFCLQPKGAWTLNLRPYRKEYVRERVYTAVGRLMKPTTGAVDGVGLMRVTGRGSRPTLVALQSIWGTYHANDIGRATVRWRWSRGRLRITRVGVEKLKQHA
ncbi:MAG TPA: hypothetical protein VGM51_11350 [Armatimonadota bacterium]|jgi:hypothetical protein